MSYPPQGNAIADVSGLATLANQTTLLNRLTAARAGYLDNIDNVVLKTLTAMRGTDSAALASSWTSALATALANYNATRAGYLDELAAANMPADVDTLKSRLSSVRAGYLDALNRQRPDMVFASGGGYAPIAIPAVAADLTFPSVVVEDLPSGLSIARADMVLVIGALFDTSAAENQVAAASKTLRVKVSTGAWGTDDIVCLTFQQNSLQVDSDTYRGGPVLFGATDISSVVTGNATYNFRSDETNRSDAVVATGASLELLDVSVVIRIWFN